jgi:hypothetical protein
VIVGSGSPCMLMLLLIGSKFQFFCICPKVEGQGVDALTEVIVKALMSEGGLS